MTILPLILRLYMYVSSLPKSYVKTDVVDFLQRIGVDLRIARGGQNLRVQVDDIGPREQVGTVQEQPQPANMKFSTTLRSKLYPISMFFRRR